VRYSVRDTETEGDLLSSGEYQQYSATSKKEIERIYKALAQGVYVKRLDRPIKVIKAVPPDYPKFLMDAEIDGTVVIDFVVNEQGSVEGALVRVPAHNKLNSVCLKAVEKWRFEPMTSGGKPVKVRMRQVFPFQYNRRKGRH